MTLNKFPDAEPSITLDFLKSKKLDPRLAFIRASDANATPYPITGEGYGTVNGRLYEFPPNVPRLTDQGLLIEGPSTNHAGFTANMSSNWEWRMGGVPQSVITNNTTETTAPDGSNTAAKVVPISGATNIAQESVAFPSFITPDNRDDYNFASSFYIKAAGFTDIRWTLQSVAASNLDLAAGTASAGATFIDVGNGWYYFTLTTGGWQNNRGFQFSLNSGSGNGTDGFYLWGIQFEWEKSFPSSYIETTTASAVTRAADVCTMNEDNISSWYNLSEGTAVTKFYLNGSDDNSTLYLARAVGANSAVGIFAAVRNDGNEILSQNMHVGDRDRLTMAAGATMFKQSVKLATAYTLTGMQTRTSVDIETNTAETITTEEEYPEEYFFGYTSGVGGNPDVNWLYGYLQSFTYYPTQVSSDALQALTTQ